MRKRSLLAAVVAGVAAVRTKIAVGEQEFQGRAAPFVSTVAVMRCARMEKNASSACNEQCAEVWCDSDMIGGCTLETRQTVRVVDNCTNCGLGDVALSCEVYQQLSGANAHWIPIRWTCVDCGLSSGGSSEIEGIGVRRMEEVICPGSSSRVDLAPDEVGVGVISVESTTNETRKVVASSGDSSFSDLGLTASTDTDTSGSLDVVVELPSVDNSDSNIWPDSSSTQINATSWNGLGEKTASPAPTFPSVPSAMSSSVSSSLSSPVNGDLSSPTPIVSPASTSNRGTWFTSPTPASSRGGIAPSTSSPASIDPTSGDISYPDENPRDKSNLSTTTSTSHGLSGSSSTRETSDKNRSSASTDQSAGSTNKSSSDGNFSATSAVARSPFFYASLMLGVMSLIGIIVGYRAKRKRNHRNEMRALRTPMRQSTRTPTPTSCRVSMPLTLSSLDSHNIVIL